MNNYMICRKKFLKKVLDIAENIMYNVNTKGGRCKISRKVSKSKDELNSDDVYTRIFSKMKFWVDEDDDGKIYVEYRGNDKIEFRSINDATFTAFVWQQYRVVSKVSTAPSFSSVLKQFTDAAILNEKTVRVHSRIAGNDTEIVYFLANDGNQKLLIKQRI